MRDISRKSTEAENKINDYIFSLREIIFDKIQRVQDLSAEIFNLVDEDNGFTAEETLSMKFSIFTKTKLLMIHSFIEVHNSSNLQQSSKSSLSSRKGFSMFLNVLLTKTLLSVTLLYKIWRI